MEEEMQPYSTDAFLFTPDTYKPEEIPQLVIRDSFPAYRQIFLLAEEAARRAEENKKHNNTLENEKSLRDKAAWTAIGALLVLTALGIVINQTEPLRHYQVKPQTLVFEALPRIAPEAYPTPSAFPNIKPTATVPVFRVSPDTAPR